MVPLFFLIVFNILGGGLTINIFNQYPIQTIENV